MRTSICVQSRQERQVAIEYSREKTCYDEPVNGSGRITRVKAVWWSVCALASVLWGILVVEVLAFGRRAPLLKNMFPGGPVMDDLSTYLTRIRLLGTPVFYVPHEKPPTFAYPPAAAYLFRVIYAVPHYKVLYLALSLIPVAAFV